MNPRRPNPEAARAFCEALRALCVRHGIAIEGGRLVLMSSEHVSLSCSMGDDGKLQMEGRGE